MATPGKPNPASDPGNQRRAANSNQTNRPEGVRRSPVGQQSPQQSPQRGARPPQQVPPQMRQQNAAFPQTNYQPGSPGGGMPSQNTTGRATATTPGQQPPGAGPAPVRVPGQGSTNQSYSGLTEQTIGSPLMILEPASTMTRFYTRSGGIMGLLLFAVIGVLFPGLILGIQALIVADGSASSSILLKGFLFCFGVFWLPVGMIFGNYYLISTKTYLSVHQQGLFIRQAKYLFLNTSEFTVPFNQIDCIKVGFVRTKVTNASRMMMSKSKYEGIEELASADLNIFMLTGKRICVPGFAKMFNPNSVQRFYQSVSHFMR